MAQPNVYPALQVQQTDVLSPFMGLQDNRRQNQLVDLQQQRFQAQQDQQAQAEAERQQFNTLIPQMLNPTEAMIAGESGQLGTAAPNRNALIAQAFALDPQRTQQILAFQQQQQAAQAAARMEAAKKDYNEAAWVLKSDRPLLLMRTSFPDDYQELVKLAQSEGIEESELTDEHAIEVARRVQAITGSQIGEGPAGDGEGFTLGKDQVRFDAQGNPIARGPEGTEDDDPSDKIFSRADKLRDEFVAQTKDFETISSAYQNILSSAGDSSGASDISLVYGFMKFQDPNSTVREGEYATAENAGGVPDRFRALYNKAIDGQFLTPRVRADFVAQAGKLYAGQTERYEQKRKRYTELASRAQVDPRDVVGDPSTVQPRAAAAPPAGERKSVGGKNYVKVDGQWYEDDGA